MSDTDLHNAVERGDFDKVQHLIWQQKVDVNKKDWFGTALHVASRSRNRPQLNIVRELLKAPDIKVNEVNVYGDRAIHDAVFFNRIHALRELLRHPSINVTDPSKDGCTPIDLARKLGHSECEKLIKMHLEKMATKTRPLRKTHTFLTPIPEQVKPYKNGHSQDEDSESSTEELIESSEEKEVNESSVEELNAGTKTGDGASESATKTGDGASESAKSRSDPDKTGDSAVSAKKPIPMAKPKSSPKSSANSNPSVVKATPESSTQDSSLGKKVTEQSSTRVIKIGKPVPPGVKAEDTIEPTKHSSGTLAERRQSQAESVDESMPSSNVREGHTNQPETPLSSTTVEKPEKQLEVMEHTPNPPGTKPSTAVSVPAKRVQKNVDRVVVLTKTPESPLKDEVHEKEGGGEETGEVGTLAGESSQEEKLSEPAPAKEIEVLNSMIREVDELALKLPEDSPAPQTRGEKKSAKSVGGKAHPGTNLYIKNFPLSWGERELAMQFMKFGNVRGVKVARRKGGFSKGFGFVSLDSEEGAKLACQAVIVVGGVPLYINRHEKKDQRREKFKQQSIVRKVYTPRGRAIAKPKATKNSISQSSHDRLTNLYVKNFPLYWTEKQLAAWFLDYGELVGVKVMRHKNGTSKGFGFVQYATPKMAEDALQTAIFAEGQKLYVRRHEKKVERTARLNRAFRQGGGTKYLQTPRRPQRKRRGQYPNTFSTAPAGYYQNYYRAGGHNNVGQHARYNASSSDAMLR